MSMMQAARALAAFLAFFAVGCEVHITVLDVHGDRGAPAAPSDAAPAAR